MSENDNEILNSLHKSINELLDVVKTDDEPVKAPEPEPVKEPEPVVKEPTNNIIDNVKSTVSNMFESKEQQPTQQPQQQAQPQLSDFMNFSMPSIPNRSDFMQQLNKDYNTFNVESEKKSIVSFVVPAGIIAVATAILLNGKPVVKDSVNYISSASTNWG